MNPIILDEYRQHINLKRGAYGMSVAEFARRSGVSRVTMSRFLNGHAMVSVSTINTCLTVLDEAGDVDSYKEAAIAGRGWFDNAAENDIDTGGDDNDDDT